MSEQKPSVGRIVHYRVSKSDAGEIMRRCVVAAGEGDMLPAIIVASDPADTHGTNLQVLLNGHGTFWAGSRKEGTGPGEWSWPPRV